MDQMKICKYNKCIIIAAGEFIGIATVLSVLDFN